MIFTIYVMRQRVGADNLFIVKKQIDVSFSWVCPVIDNEFHHNIVKVAVDMLCYDEIHDEQQGKCMKN